MSAVEDLRKAREAVYGGVWTWERHGDGWALYVNRGLPLDPTETGPFVSRQHGLNILTVGADGFDRYGEPLRAFIVAAAEKVPMLKAERDAERLAWARYVRAERAAMCAKRDGGGLDDWHAEQADAEHEAAKQALLALGVDVDSLSGAT